MAEKFRKIVNAPHKAFGKLNRKIEAMRPKTLRGMVLREAGLLTTDMFRFLLWTTKYAVLDNHLIRAGEKALRNEKSPNFTAHVIYYLMAAMTLGGVRTYQENQSLETVPDTHKVAVQPKVSDIPTYEANTYGAYLAKMRGVTPLLIADLILPEGVCMENGMHVVYDDKVLGKKLKPGQKAKGKPTIGFGSTVIDGKPVNSRTRPITTEKAYDEARRHVEEQETYFLMYCYETAMPEAKIQDTGTALMVASALYNLGSQLIEDPKDFNHGNRFEILRQAYKKYGNAIPDSIVRDAFKKYPVVAPTSFGKIFLGLERGSLTDSIGNFLGGGTGLIWRRWIEAGLASGQIKGQELLDIPLGCMSEFFYIMKKKTGGNGKKAFWIERNGKRTRNNATIAEWREWVRHPVDRHGHSLAGKKKVRDVLPTEVVAMCRSGLCEIATEPAQIMMAKNIDDTSVVPSNNKSRSNVYKAGAKKLGNDAHRAKVELTKIMRDGNLTGDRK